MINKQQGNTEFEYQQEAKEFIVALCRALHRYGSAVFRIEANMKQVR